MNGSTDFNWNESDLPLDRLLTEGSVNGCIVLLSADERPPLGCAGMLDWRTHGAISASIRARAFTGASGECAYFPWNFHGDVRHLVLLGIGSTTSPGARGPLNPLAIAALEKNLRKMGAIHWAVSRTEFPEKTWVGLSKTIPEGGSLWISS